MAILSVRNLKISFWTNNGTVKAVRDISFDVEEGKTLAIVGESGSGKSVTAKAMLGILAGNAIIEGGEIYFDGKDLLKVPEETFHQIRGNNIAMIFQDPLSSLNPIVKVGKQLTEAMVANNYAQRRQSKENCKVMFKALENHIAASGVSSSEAGRMVSEFTKHVGVGNKLESEYTVSRDTLETVISNIEGAKIALIDKPYKEVSTEIKHVIMYIEQSYNRFLIPRTDANFRKLIETLENATREYKAKNGAAETKKPVNDALEALLPPLKAALERPNPSFLPLGYYASKKGIESLDDRKIAELNDEANALFDSEFRNDFTKHVEAAIQHAEDEANGHREKTIAYMDSILPKLNAEFDPKFAQQVANESKPLVLDSINKLDTEKDAVSYTYANAIDNAVNLYTLAYKSENYNEKKKQRVRKRDRLPENLDMDGLRGNIRSTVENAKRNLEERNASDRELPLNEKAADLIDFLDEESSRKDYKISKALAKSRAIDLMEEVGIPLPRARYNQYPFELSGGMRQRIVIAIALASNPDILICDEPTTALDVTIQAQILDLINDLKKKRNLSVIFITHDLGVVANMADTIAVMYAGKIVEFGESEEIFYQSVHPYTWALLASMPDLDTSEKLEYIPGVPPNMIYPPKGDAFAARNKYALAIDFEEQPPMFEVSPTHYAATWLLHPDAPKVDPPAIITDRIKRMHDKWGGILDE